MSINFKKNRVAIIAFVVLAIATIGLISLNQLPTKAVAPSDPPNHNVAAPLNAGSATQTILGGLNIATTSGKVGIGTSAPVATLDIYGGPGNSAQTEILRIDRGWVNGSNEAGDIKFKVDRFSSVNSFANQRLQINMMQRWNQENNILTLQSDGNVGIGTPAPTSKLQVVGLLEYSDNVAATNAGLTIGAFYRTGDILKVVH